MAIIWPAGSTRSISRPGQSLASVGNAGRAERGKRSCRRFRTITAGDAGRVPAKAELVVVVVVRVCARGREDSLAADVVGSALVANYRAVPQHRGVTDHELHVVSRRGLGALVDRGVHCRAAAADRPELGRYTHGLDVDLGQGHGALNAHRRDSYVVHQVVVHVAVLGVGVGLDGNNVVAGARARKREAAAVGVRLILRHSQLHGSSAWCR